MKLLLPDEEYEFNLAYYGLTGCGLQFKNSCLKMVVRLKPKSVKNYKKGFSFLTKNLAPIEVN